MSGIIPIIGSCPISRRRSSSSSRARSRSSSFSSSHSDALFFFHPVLGRVVDVLEVPGGVKRVKRVQSDHVTTHWAEGGTGWKGWSDNGSRSDGLGELLGVGREGVYWENEGRVEIGGMHKRQDAGGLPQERTVVVSGVFRARFMQVDGYDCIFFIKADAQGKPKPAAVRPPDDQEEENGGKGSSNSSSNNNSNSKINSNSSSDSHNNEYNDGEALYQGVRVHNGIAEEVLLPEDFTVAVLEEGRVVILGSSGVWDWNGVKISDGGQGDVATLVDNSFRMVEQNNLVRFGDRRGEWVREGRKLWVNWEDGEAWSWSIPATLFGSGFDASLDEESANEAALVAEGRTVNNNDCAAARPPQKQHAKFERSFVNDRPGREIRSGVYVRADSSGVEIFRFEGRFKKKVEEEESRYRNMSMLINPLPDRIMYTAIVSKNSFKEQDGVVVSSFDDKVMVGDRVVSEEDGRITFEREGGWGGEEVHLTGSENDDDDDEERQQDAILDAMLKDVEQDDDNRKFRVERWEWNGRKGVNDDGVWCVNGKKVEGRKFLSAGNGVELGEAKAFHFEEDVQGDVRVDFSSGFVRAQGKCGFLGSSAKPLPYTSSTSSSDLFPLRLLSVSPDSDVRHLLCALFGCRNLCEDGVFADALAKHKDLENKAEFNFLVARCLDAQAKPSSRVKNKMFESSIYNPDLSTSFDALFAAKKAPASSSSPPPPVTLDVFDITSHTLSPLTIMSLYLSSNQPEHVRKLLPSPTLLSALQLSPSLWLRSGSDLVDITEKVAGSLFRTTKSAKVVALWYIALGKKKTLLNLARTGDTLTDKNLVKLLQNFDFATHSGRGVAQKNAFSLLRKRDYMFAAGVFLLAEPPMLKEAVDVMTNKGGMWQVAFWISRLIEGGIGEVGRKLLSDVSSDTCNHFNECDGLRGVCKLWLNDCPGAADCAEKFVQEIVSEDFSFPPPSQVYSTLRLSMDIYHVPSILSSLSVEYERRTSLTTTLCTTLCANGIAEVGLKIMKAHVKHEDERDAFESVDVCPTRIQSNGAADPMSMSSSIFDDFDAPVSRAPLPKNKKAEPAVDPMSTGSSIFDNFDAPKAAKPLNSRTPPPAPSSAPLSDTPSPRVASPPSLTLPFDPLEPPRVSLKPYERLLPFLPFYQSSLKVALASSALVEYVYGITRDFTKDCEVKGCELSSFQVASDVLMQVPKADLLDQIFDKLAEVCKLGEVEEKDVLDRAALQLSRQPVQFLVAECLVLECLERGRSDGLLRRLSHKLVEGVPDLWSSQGLNEDVQYYAGIAWQFEVCLWLGRAGLLKLSDVATSECIICVRVCLFMSFYPRNLAVVEDLFKFKPECNMCGDQEGHKASMRSPFDLCEKLSSSNPRGEDNEEGEGGVKALLGKGGGWQFLVDVSRDESESVLRDEGTGAFLIRPSRDQSDMFSLSFNGEDGVQHAVIRLEESGFRCGSYGPYAKLYQGKMIRSNSDISL